MGSFFFRQCYRYVFLFLCVQFCLSANLVQSDDQPFESNIEKERRIRLGGVLPEDLAQEERLPWGRGPVDFRNEQVLYLNHIQLGTESPEVLRKGQVWVQVRGAWSQSVMNYSTPDGQTTIDAETISISPIIRVGLTDRIQLSAEFPIINRNDGIWDSTVIWVEKNFTGDIRHERTERPLNKYKIEGTTDDGKKFNYDHGVGLGKIQLGIKFNAIQWNKEGVALSFQGLVALPTGTKGYGDQGVDGAVQVTGSKRLDDFVLYAGATAAVFGSDIGPIKVRPLKLAAFSALEYELTKNWSIVAQFGAESPTTYQLKGTPGPILFMGLGVKGEIKGFLIEIGGLENGGDVTRSADFTLHIAIGYKF